MNFSLQTTFILIPPYQSGIGVRVSGIGKERDFA